jgi:hypothetical protein
MFHFIITSLLLTHFVFYNYGNICLWLLQTYSRIQMRMQPPKKVCNKIEDGLECLVEERIIKYTVDSALDKINDSDVSVLVSNKNMIIFYPPIESYVPDYEQSNVRFVALTICINDDLSVEHTIQLETSDYSFYVVGNELNVDFVRYYFLRFKNIFLPADVDYNMTIVDENIEFYSLDQNECIALEKDDYQIFTYKDYVEEEEEEALEEDEQKDDVNENGDIYICDDGVIYDANEQEKEEEEVQQQDQVPDLIGSPLYTILPTDDCDLDIDQLIQIERDMMDEHDQNTLIDDLVTEYENFLLNAKKSFDEMSFNDLN